MKQLTFLFLLMGLTCYSQVTEFRNSSNGLIYSDTTIRQLKFIVDSLNLKFKVCDLNKTYQSLYQARAHYVSLENGKILAAKLDMDANISFEDFIVKYNQAIIEKALPVVRFIYKNYEGNDVMEISSIELSNKYGHEFHFNEDLQNYSGPLKGKWIYKYHDKSEYSKESLDAFYFTDGFSQQPVPVTYARMIQYADCMVDTTTQVFYEKANRSGRRHKNDESSKVKTFMNYVHQSTQMPEYGTNYNEKEYEKYWIKYQLWDSLRFSRVDSLKNSDKKFVQLLNEAVSEALNKGGTNDEFEEYVGIYYSRKTELELKRNRIVVGGCSQDNSPRIHALNIAILSAETINWEIFLRSHLDIMNDRFERVSDGSYAWGRRKTYIKELEVLEINVPDLLLGISLRIENPSENHYFGSIGRLGRALAESNNRSDIETKMLQMISDKQLDDYNRILIYYLFLNYNHYLESKNHQKANREKLITAVKTMPEYLATKITIE